VLDRFGEIARQPLEVVWSRRFGRSGHLATGLGHVVEVLDEQPPPLA
jgi:hypothetical protein